MGSVISPVSGVQMGDAALLFCERGVDCRCVMEVGRGHTGEVILLTFLGFIWLLVSLHLVRWLGVDVADDVIERRNPAALIALWCATFGIATIYAGGNLGEGPSYWNNIFSTALGTIGFFALWLV